MADSPSRILVLRTVNFQILPRLVLALRGRWGDGARRELLTHAWGSGWVASRDWARIHDVPGTGEFSPRDARALAGESFDAVVVPVSNLEGWGYENALRLAARIQCRDLWLFTAGGLVRLPRAALAARLLWSRLAGLLSWPLALGVMGVWLLIRPVTCGRIISPGSRAEPR